MYFGTKNYLKSNHNHTTNHILKGNCLLLYLHASPLAVIVTCRKMQENNQNILSVRTQAEYKFSHQHVKDLSMPLLSKSMLLRVHFLVCLLAFVCIL